MAKSKKPKGTSRAVRRVAVVETRTGSATSTVLKSRLLRHEALAKEREESQRRLQQAFSGLSGRTVEQLRDLHPRAGPSTQPAHSEDIEPSYTDLQDVGDAMEVDGWVDDDEEEQGGDVLHALRDFLGERWKYSKYQGTRSWRQRLERADELWTAVLDEITDAYMRWRYPSAGSLGSHSDNPPLCPLRGRAHPATTPQPSRTPSGLHTQGPNGEEDDVRPSGSNIPRSTDVAGDPSAVAPEDAEGGDLSDAQKRDGTFDFTIDVVDMYSLARQAHVPRDASQTTVIALAEQGYLATSPASPSLAITFNTLEHFRLLRLRKPSFSIEAFAKVLCDSYALPYRRRYRTALSDCLDVYLAVLRKIDKRVQQALNRDTADWRVKNACPACCYELDGEPHLTFARIIALDGNNSLKRVAKFGDREVADTREFGESDYYLPAAFVDIYKDEVKRTGEVAPPAVPMDDHSYHLDHDDRSDTDTDTNADDAASDDGDPKFRECTQNWKAAGKDEDKKMWGIFDESGIFASACRHGFILWISDMIKSGELSKHPLSHVGKSLKVLGPRLLFGYDIGCAFCGTIFRSTLGPEFRRLCCRCCVNAFHGYSHSHRCQTQHHPSVIVGAGLEDMETMERIFSASNQLAPVIRYASKYHRRLFIDLFFKQWDEDKYANLVTMLLNNYRQALGIMKEESAAVNEALRTLQCTHEDLARWQAEEAAYFARVGTEDPANAAAVEYVTLLRELRTVENQVATTMSSFMTSIPEDYSISSPRIAKTSNPTYYSDASRTRKKETERRLLREKRDNTLRDVIALEIKMGIDTRWRPDMTEYQTTLKYIAERDYQVALEKLHGLVVQRLFELHNLNISQTAYKVRTYIAKNLQRRSKAIRTAVKQYNAAAQALTPPHPPLDWTKVTHYTFLDEFELLRDTTNDIRAKPWAQPLVRETMKKARRVIRAQEEVVRCNVEIRRLHTSILDENRMLDDAVSDARTRADPVLGPLELFATRRKRVNMRLLAVVAQIHDLEGFSGEKTPGRRLGPVPQDSASAPADEQEIERERAELQVDDQADFVEDADLEDMEKLVNFAMNIT